MTATGKPVVERAVQGAEVRVYASAEELFAAMAQMVSDTIAHTLEKQLRCSIALSGGSTPKRVYELLGRAHSEVDWPRVRVYFVDERNVGPDSPESNYGMVQRALLASGKVPARNVHRIQGELPAVEAASHYEEEMKATLQTVPGHFPELDLVMLGMGQDGHTASLFPGSPALDEKKHWVVANPVAKMETTRITMTFPVINAARNVVVLVAGSDKAEMVKMLFSGTAAGLPMQRVKPTGRLVWMVDGAAAGDTFHEQ
jgi:6-phosphogluconolactonase